MFTAACYSSSEGGDYVSAGNYLEGQGDLVSRLIAPISHIATLNIPIINILTKFLTLQVRL